LVLRNLRNGRLYEWCIPIPVGQGSPKQVEATAVMSTEDDLKPVRINYDGVTLPPPNKKTLEAMAVKAWLDYSAQMALLLDHEMPTWDELPANLQDVWVRIARGQHVVLSLLGGGKVEVIDDAE